MKIETLLYLFFIILTVVAPLLRKRKAAKAAAKPVQPKKPEDDDFFTTLQKQLEKLEVPVIVDDKSIETNNRKNIDIPKKSFQQYENYDDDYTEETTTEYENYEQSITSYDEIKPEKFSYDEQNLQSSSPAIAIKQVETVPLSGQQKATEYSISNQKGEFHFDPLAAIIYSEVLKRPEY